jgi:hypothetical protein
MRHFLRAEVGLAVAQALLAVGMEPRAAAGALVDAAGAAERVTALGGATNRAAVATALGTAAAEQEQGAASAALQEPTGVVRRHRRRVAGFWTRRGR